MLALVISWGSLGLELAVSVVSGRGMRDPGLLGLSMGRGGECHMPLAWDTEVPRGVHTAFTCYLPGLRTDLGCRLYL